MFPIRCSFSQAFYILCLLLFSSTCIRAQEDAGNRILHYQTHNGLSFGVVTSITQDKDGFIWVATADGLNRFDGFSFKVYKSNSSNPKALASNFINSVFLDGQGTLWIATKEGLQFYDHAGDCFIQYELSGSDIKGKSVQISAAENGNFWIKLNNKFGYLDSRTKKCLTYSRANLPSLSIDNISTVFQDEHGLLWVGNRDKGVDVFRVKNGRITGKINLKSDILSSITPNRIAEDNDGNIWIATPRGLVYYERSSSKAQVLPLKLRSNFFECIFQTDNRILIGLRDGGLYQVRPLQKSNITLKEFNVEPVNDRSGYNITYSSVKCIFQDRDKNIWIGTHGNGLYLISKMQEKFIRHEKVQKDQWGESYLRYYGMCQDKSGNLWMGTDGDGIYKITSDGQLLEHFKRDGQAGSLQDNAILAAFCDSKGRLWFGSHSQGLFLYRPESNSFQQFLPSQSGTNSIGGTDVRIIFEDSQGKIWIGMYRDGGISCLEPISQKITSYRSSSSQNLITSVASIAEDPTGIMYIGTYGNGLICYDRRSQKFYPAFHNPDENPKAILSLIINRNQILEGTEGNGVLVYDLHSKRRLKWFNEQNGLCNNTINAMKLENDTTLWLSTNKGLSRINLSTSAIWNFDESDGLQNGQFNGGSVIYDSKRGYMCFGGTRGWNLFYLSRIKKSNYKPIVLLTGLQLFDAEQEIKGNNPGFSIKNIRNGSKIKLPYDQGVFAIHYAALNFPYPQKGEYAYMLEGLDKAWNFVKDQRSAVYRYLAPGEYRFLVKASNQDGIWFDNSASITVVILPPWYRSWWAYLIYSIVFGTIIYLYLRYKQEQARLKFEVKLAQMEAEKEKELNERKLSFFTHISHEFRTPLTLIINPIKDLLSHVGNNTNANGLNIIHRNARRLLSLVDQLLLFRKADNGEDSLKLVKLNFVEFCREVSLCFSHQAKSKSINFQFESDSPEIEVYADREKMEIILFNLLSNAFKFTPECGNINLKITECSTELEVHVVDSGKGINPEIGQRLFDKFYQAPERPVSISGFGIGLFLVKKFTEAHKGSITYLSEPGIGTDFCLIFKKGTDHFPGHDIFEEASVKSVFLHELMEEPQMQLEALSSTPTVKEAMITDKPTILLIDDNEEIRKYLKDILGEIYQIYEAADGATGFEYVKKYSPDLVISDIIMPGLSGVELCQRVKDDPVLNHILIILLTSSSATDVKLKGIEVGADDYITKPFDKDLLTARVANILKSRYNLKQHFFNAITLKTSGISITGEDKVFIEKCIEIIEQELDSPYFTIKTLSDKVRMSHSTLYRRVKMLTGKSVTDLVRIVRLRKAAELFIYTNSNVNEVALRTGFNDIKNFRDQFYRLFEMNPSDYIKKYRKPFNNSYRLNSVITSDVSRATNTQN